MIKLSVIIPAYNAEKYISECLNSIISQGLTDYEIIIVNDGSRDETVAVCKQYIYQHTLKNIKLINQQNSGVSVARNKGILEASGEWVTFVDADDLLLPNTMSLLKNICKNDADIVLGEYTRDISDIKQENIVTSKIDAALLMSCCLRFSKYYKSVRKNYNVDPYSNWACWAKFYRREWLISENIEFPEGVFTSEDCLFLIRAFSKKPRVIATNIKMYYYRINNESVTNKFNPLIIDNYNKIFELLKNFLSPYDDLQDVDVYISERIVDCLRQHLLFNKKMKISSFALIFNQKKYLESVYRCPLRKVFIGKKNTIMGTYLLLRLKLIYRKINYENTAC